MDPPLLRVTLGGGHWCHQEAATHWVPSPSIWRVAQELWAKLDTFPCHTESEFLKTGKPPGFFKWFSTWVWKILFPDRKFDSHFTKSMGTWLNCIIAPYKRTLRRNCVFQACLHQYEQNCMLVFKHPGSSLSSVVWLYNLKTPLWKLFRAMVPAQFLSTDVRPNYTEIGLLKEKTSPTMATLTFKLEALSEPHTHPLIRCSFCVLALGGGWHVPVVLQSSHVLEFIQFLRLLTCGKTLCFDK